MFKRTFARTIPDNLRAPHMKMSELRPEHNHGISLPCFLPPEKKNTSSFAKCLWEKSKWGISKWRLKVLVHLVHDCLRLSSFCYEKFPLERGPPKKKCRIVDDCAQIAECGLKPPYESPHLDFPQKCYLSLFLTFLATFLPIPFASPFCLPPFAAG